MVEKRYETSVNKTLEQIAGLLSRGTSEKILKRIGEQIERANNLSEALNTLRTRNDDRRNTNLGAQITLLAKIHNVLTIWLRYIGENIARVMNMLEGMGADLGLKGKYATRYRTAREGAEEYKFGEAGAKKLGIGKGNKNIITWLKSITKNLGIVSVGIAFMTSGPMKALVNMFNILITLFVTPFALLFFKILYPLLLRMIDIGLKFFDGMMSFIEGDWGAGWDKMKDVFTDVISLVIDILVGLLVALGVILAAGFLAIETAIMYLAASLIELLFQIIAGLASIVTSIAAILIEVAGRIVDGLLWALQWIAEGIDAIFGTDIAGTIETVREKIKDFKANAQIWLLDIPKKIKELGNNIKTYLLENFAEKAKKYLTNLVKNPLTTIETISNIIKGVLDSIWNTLKSGFEKVSNAIHAIGHIGDSVTSAVKSALGLDDFVIKDGNLFSINPSDTIVGYLDKDRGVGPIATGAGGGTFNITISGLVDENKYREITRNELNKIIKDIYTR
jgi:hypothetical protein